MSLNPITVLKHSLKLSYLPLICALSACGGSADDKASPSSPTANSSLSSSAHKDMCASPRTGLDPFNNNRPYPDKAGSLQNEKDWLRAWIDETYLWYQEVPKNLNPSHYATAIDYFNALKTPVLTASGKEKDHYHYTYNTTNWNQLFQSGLSIGYGFKLSYISENVPRKYIVAYIEPQSPADLAGVRRGMEIDSIDGVDFINSNNISALYDAISPAKKGENHTFTFKSQNGHKIVANLFSKEIRSNPVHNVKSIDTLKGKVGYLTFNDHNSIAEEQLIKAISQLKNEQVNDLVIDLRYNGGGYLNIAAELAYMIAGPVQTQGKTFEKTIFNDKQPFGGNTIIPFYNSSQFSPTQQPLPYLGLKQVTILAGNNTCSASESLINGLRGVNVQVNLIGGQTCGKPYGFMGADNCGTTYLAIQMKGENNKGESDFTDGFPPTCSVEDDYSQELGNPLERRLAAGLNFIAKGQCPANGQSKGDRTESKLLRSPLQEIKIINQAQ